MSISGSLTRCSNHTQCRTDEYCARAEGIATGTPRCVHCQYCNDPTRPSSLDPFDHGDCPLQCRCQRHEDCDDDSYCARFNEFTQVCLSCRHCRGEPRNHRMPVDSNSHCPDKCLCVSSKDCVEGEYCQRQPIRSMTPNNRGSCIGCASDVGCVDYLLLDSAMSCPEVCDGYLECLRHLDCGKSGEWCSMNHRCHPCSSECLSSFSTNPFITMDIKDETNPGEGNTLVEVISTSDLLSDNVKELLSNRETFTLTNGESLDAWLHLPQQSIEMTCPLNCCDWENAVRPNTPAVFKVHPCDPRKVVTGLWMPGSRPNATVSDFLQRGQPCSVQRQEFFDDTTGESTTISIVDCTQAGVTCEKVERTIAVLLLLPIYNDEDVTRNVSSYHVGTIFATNEFPLPITFDQVTLGCILSRASDNIALQVFVTLLCSVIIFISFICLVMWCRRLPEVRRTQALDSTTTTGDLLQPLQKEQQLQLEDHQEEAKVDNNGDESVVVSVRSNLIVESKSSFEGEVRQDLVEDEDMAFFHT